MCTRTRTYRNAPQLWAATAREWTSRHACDAWSVVAHAGAPPPVRQRVRFLLTLQQRVSKVHGLGGALADVWLKHVMPRALVPDMAASADVLPADEIELFREAASRAIQAAHESARAARERLQPEREAAGADSKQQVAREAAAREAAASSRRRQTLRS